MFHPSIYKLFNNDLKNLNNNQLNIHWKTIGKKENRISNVKIFFNKYPNFKINLYKERYPELNNYDDLVIMAHYHHNDLRDQNDLDKTIDDQDNKLINYVDKYLNKYYIYDANFCIIILNYNNKKNFNDYDQDCFIFTNQNLNTKCINNIIKTEFNIYKINDLILNLNYDYYLFLKNTEVKFNTDLIDKNANIIYHNDYIFVKKQILRFINFYTIINFNINNLNINNIITIDNDNKIKYINYKFYNLNNILKKNTDNYSNKVFINIDLNSYNDLFYIIQLISYLENKKYDVYLKENNYIFFKNYLIIDENLDLKLINDINDLDNDNFIIDEKIKFNNVTFHYLNKINKFLLLDIFKNILFLDLKKNIIIIYFDKNIDEEFIINSLINVNFQESIIILVNYKKYNYELFDNLPYLLLEDIYEYINTSTNLSYLDLELCMGFFTDIYIGPANYLSLIWNYLFNNIILYTDNYSTSYSRNQNLIINKNVLTITDLNNKIINYNFNLYKINNNKLLNIDYKYDLYTNYYFNDYIFKIYFNKDSFVSKEELINTNNKNISILKYENNYYIKYFNQYEQIYNEFLLNYFMTNTNSNQIINVNRSKIINNYVFVIQIYDIHLINYYEDQFEKYYFDKNYILEFYIKINNQNINSSKKKTVINSLNSNNFIIILENIYHKYNENDLIFIFKNSNFNAIDINNEILIYLQNNKMYYNSNQFIILNLNIFNNDHNNDNKEIYDILKLNRKLNKSNDIDQNILFYLENNYINNYNFNEMIYNNNVLLKFLIYYENTNLIYYNFNNINYEYELLKNQINYFEYNLSKEILKLIINDNYNDDDSISDIDDEYSVSADDKNNEYYLNLNNLNLFINKLDNNYYFIYKIKNIDIDIQKIKLKNTIILNEFNELIILIIDVESIKKIGFLNNYYFKNNSLIDLNLYIINKLISPIIYKYDNNKFLDSQLNINSKIERYFNNINLNNIVNVRYISNLNINNYNEIIDIYIINLKNRTDKKQYIINQLNKLNILHYKFFDAYKIKKEDLHNYSFIKPEKFLNHLNINYVIGSAGCKISHYELIKSIQENNKYSLILEDDVVLEYNFIDYIFCALKQLKNKEFDLLYLGCNLTENNNYLFSNNLLSVKYPKTTTAYLIQNYNKNKILNIIEDSNNEIDEVYANSDLNKYCIYPMIAYQKNIKSDIINNNDYGYYHDKYFFNDLNS